ncbi:MAG: DNA polymerase III subunit beta, partial [Patescibacteria group bacterium]
MKFICTRENFSHALDVVGGVVGKQANLPILSHVCIVAADAKVEFIGTNLEVAIRASVRAKVDSAGSFTVPAKTLADFVHLLMDEQVEVELKENELHIRSGNSYTKIKGVPADEFPVIPDVEETHGYVLLVNPFRDALSKVISSAA